MQWYKKIKNFLTLLFEPDIVNDFVDDSKPYYVLAEERSFMQSSVKGDFRLYPLSDGFCACWRDCLVARNTEGLLLWKIEGWGRALAVHPEGVIFAAVQEQSICLFNAATGNALREPVQIGVYLDFLIWIDKNRMVGSDGTILYLFNSNAEIIDVIEGAIDAQGFIGGISADIHNPEQLTVLDVNEHQLKKIDLKQRRVIKEKDVEYAEQLLCNPQHSWIWTTVVNGTTLEEIRVYEGRSLRERFGLIFNGKKGIRFANQGPNDMSFHSIVSLPALSPLRQHFLINDNSGLLWLIDARTGDKRRVFRRNLLDYVYAVLWLDAEHFVAMLEGGYVAKMSVRGTELLFKEQDF